LREAGLGEVEIGAPLADGVTVDGTVRGSKTIASGPERPQALSSQASPLRHRPKHTPLTLPQIGGAKT
jgi:hypothetical protein